MSPRAILAIMVGLGLAMGLFLVMTLLLTTLRGEDFLSSTVLAVLGLGCMLVVARPAWAISGRILSPGE